METLIVHPENKEQLDALKKFMKAFKINFSTDKRSNPYSVEFDAKMKRGDEDVKAGRTRTIEPGDIWNLG